MHQYTIVEHLVSTKLVDNIEKILKEIPSSLVGFKIVLVRCSISDNSLLFHCLRSQFVHKCWTCSGSYKLNEYDPFKDSIQWKAKLKQLELIYIRSLKQKHCQIKNFQKLNKRERQIMENIDLHNPL